MKVDVSLKLNVPETLKRLDLRYKKAQEYLDGEVIKDCTPYVPMKTGRLYKSAAASSKIGSGKVFYKTPYARRMYYGIHFRFSKDKHPQACAQWFEKAKAIHLMSWVKGVTKIITR